MATLQHNDALPLLGPTAREWAERAAGDLPAFLADHATCEQQAAVSALSLIGKYPADSALVERLSALAAEEIQHFRRVTALMRRRGVASLSRRSNPWVSALRRHIQSSEPLLKVDRLLVCALIEARSCERFTRLLEVIDDAEVRLLLEDLGPAEARHWRLFHDLAARDVPAAAFDERWQEWLRFEDELRATTGTRPTVHG